MVLKSICSNIIHSNPYLKLVRFWLISMLFFVPFQRNIVSHIKLLSADLAVFINRIDDMTLVIFLPLAIIEIFRNRKSSGKFFIVLSLPFIIFSILGLISGMINGNSVLITVLGIFDYLKIFLFILVYAAFFREPETFEKTFRTLLILAVVLGAIAFIQELWALSHRYILGKDIQDTGMYIFSRLPEAVKSSWRLGVYRAPSLLGHYNLLGLYSLLIFTIYIYTAKKVNLLVCFILLAGILVSMSRMIYLGLALLLVFQFLRGRKWVLYLIIPVLISLFYMSTLWDLNIWKSSILPDTTELEEVLKDRESPEIENAISFRKYTKDKAMAVWKDHSFWGVGPGMFGGTISVLYDSPVYDEYNFLKIGFFQKVMSIDQVWPQIMAEMGVAGLAGYAGLFVSLIIIYFILRQQATSNIVSNLFAGLLVFTIIIIIWGFGGDYKSAVIYTYVAFAGMGLGCCSQNCRHIKSMK